MILIRTEYFWSNYSTYYSILLRKWFCWEMHFGLCLSEDAHKSSAGDDSLMRFLIITSSRYDIKSASSPAWPIIFFSSSSHAHSKSGLVFVTFVTVKIVTILPVIDNSCGHSKIHHKNLNRQNHYYRHLVRIQFFDSKISRYYWHDKRWF